LPQPSLYIIEGYLDARLSRRFESLAHGLYELRSCELVEPAGEHASRVRIFSAGRQGGPQREILIF